MKRNAGTILKEASETFIEKQKEYGDNWRKVGPALEALFSDSGGLVLNSEDDFNRFHLLLLLVVKLTRYTTNWNEGHQDSLRDAAVYCSMLENLDDEIKNNEKDYIESVTKGIKKMQDENKDSFLGADMNLYSNPDMNLYSNPANPLPSTFHEYGGKIKLPERKLNQAFYKLNNKTTRRNVCLK